MTFRESEYPDLVRHLLDLIQRSGTSLPKIRDQADILKRLSEQYPIYPGLVLEKITRGDPDENERTASIRRDETALRVPAEWHHLAQTLAKSEFPNDRAYTVLVWGEMDTGKSSLIRFLANFLIHAGKKVGILDCDAGQSDIGPPSTIGLAVTNRAFRSFAELSPMALQFVGSHAATLHFLPALTGTARLCALAKEQCEIVLVDTAGWVTGDCARAFRQAECALVQPDAVVALERNSELECLIRSTPLKKVMRTAAPAAIQKRSRARRTRAREQLYRDYFRNAKAHIFSWREISTERAYFLTGQPVRTRSVKTLWAEKYSRGEGIFAAVNHDLTDREINKLRAEFGAETVRTLTAGAEKGILCALCDAGSDVIALCLIERIDFRRKQIAVQAPGSADMSSVRTLQIGSVRLNTRGKELGFVEPGSL